MIFSTDISRAAATLAQGGLVAIPTETVYGLGADARNETALKKVFAAKGRPADHPLIVHIADVSQLTDWACKISPDAYLLAKQCWPGSLTLILLKKTGVSDFVTGGQDTIGLRIPAHPMALDLLEKFGSGIAAPSANRFGRISPTTAEAVQEELGDSVDLILQGGQCEKGLESTIIDLSQNQPVILRPGMISVAAIEKILNKKVMAPQKNSPRVSGSLESHYAPRTKTILLMEGDFPKHNTVIVTHSAKQYSENQVVNLSNHPQHYAHDLYQVLRELDRKKFPCIYIETVPETTEWDAIRDRLKRMCG